MERDVSGLRNSTQLPHFAVDPPAIARRQRADWGFVHAEHIEVIRHESFDYEYNGARHLLIASERAERYDGETLLDGLPRSNRRAWSGRMTFIPAGCRFYGWQKPRALTRCTNLFIDPHGSPLCPELRFAEVAARPRLFFFDRDVWATVGKLAAQLRQQPCRSQRAYVEALGIALAHELARLHDGGAPAANGLRGGLPPWQQSKLRQYVEEHLADEVSLASLAALVQLSPYHFARAFKQSFGVPPHRYLTDRRIERAKRLLAHRQLAVTEIALEVGFGEASSFTAAFRKSTGETPTDYRRSLE
jgi:AraC family transcriptional regulator